MPLFSEDNHEHTRETYEINHVENRYRLMVGITSETLKLLRQLPNFRVVKGNQNGNKVAHSLA